MAGSGSGVGPTAGDTRIEYIDVLRGLCLLFILIENMALYSGQTWNLPTTTRPVERAVLVGIVFLLQAKSYSLLSFLFGWGVALQQERIEASGRRFLPFYLRRLGLLLVLGVLHGTLIWYGDVLTLYALLGLLLIPMLRRSRRALLAAAVGLLLLTVLLSAPGPAMDQVRAWYATATSALRGGAQPADVYASGTFLEVTRRRAWDYVGGLSWMAYYAGSMAGMFVLGMYAARKGVLRNIESNRRALQRAMWVSLAVALVSNELYVESHLARLGIPAGMERFVQVGVRTAGAVSMVVFYVLAVALLSRREWFRQRFAPLALVGRASASNYVLQSIICTWLYYGYGLGLYGEVALLFGTAVAVLVYLGQVRLSAWWFDRHTYGPLEWVLRRGMYGRAAPQRRGAREESGGGSAGRRALTSLRRHWRLSVFGAVLILATAAGGVIWRPRTRPVDVIVQREEVIVRRAAPAAATPTPLPVVATPVVDPVLYEPGLVAASGDLLALAQGFDPGRAVEEIAILTGDPYLGRYPSSPGGRAAGEHIAQLMEAYGLQPAGEAGTYFQSFPIEYIALRSNPALAGIIPGEPDAVYAAYRDFTPVVRQYAGAGEAEAQVVWGNSCSRGDLAAVSVTDRIVLCRDTDLLEAQRHALESGAAALLLLTDPTRRPPDFGSTLKQAWVPEPLPVLFVYPDVVSGLLVGSGQTLSDLTSSFAAFPLDARARVTVQTIGEEACSQHGCVARNVLGVLPGRDPAHRDQVVVVGAHYDHLGESPGGVAWVGANDNASGVAVMLEIARAWHEQGYVPRRTVLFAAWDAEELGLLGARYYVAHPSYPLEDTVAMFQFDMVGAGTDLLRIDGDSGLGAALARTAEVFDTETAFTQDGRSDHVPFWEAGIPANVLIWDVDTSEMPTYHRPVDTVDTIDPAKVQAVGQIGGVAVLALAEGELGVRDLLALRAAAAAEGDLEAFLATSSAKQLRDDERWFVDLWSTAPLSVTTRAHDLYVLGNRATALVQIEATYAGESTQVRTRRGSLQIRLVHTESGWKWDGPDLVDAPSPDGAVSVRYPESQEAHLNGFADAAAARLEQIAAQLALPVPSSADLMVLPSREALQVSVGLATDLEGAVWVAPGGIRLGYSPMVSGSAQLDAAFVRLLLVEQGLTEASAPLLWQGLARLVRIEDELEEPPSLAAIQDGLAEGAAEDDPTMTWAALSYLVEELGWEGVGRLIVAAGNASRNGGDGVAAFDVALTGTLGADRTGLELAWRGRWSAHIAEVQGALDRVLAERADAARAGDVGAFLSTVDYSVPGLAADEELWVRDLLAEEKAIAALAARPLAIDKEGRLRASVSVALCSQPADDCASTVEETVAEVWFRREGDAYLWSGALQARADAEGDLVLYSRGEGEESQAFLQVVRDARATLSARLGLPADDPLTLKLYRQEGAYRAALPPSVAADPPESVWVAPDGTVHLRARTGVDAAAYRPALAMSLARSMLQRVGHASEWLLTGGSTYASQFVDDGATVREADARLGALLDAVEEGTLPDLRDLAPVGLAQDESASLARTQAWDAVRYLVNTFGPNSLLAIIRAEGQGLDLDEALQEATGQSVAQFLEAWSDSLARGHTAQAWVDVAAGFDPERASDHVDVLAAPQMGGRQSGSAGATEAADYVARRFAEGGLVPASGSPGADGFKQGFPISYTTLLEAPQLEVIGLDGEMRLALTYREDFVSLLHALPGGGVAHGEVVWVRDVDYAGVDLGGKIALRLPTLSVSEEVSQAVAHGAGGLLLVGRTAGQKAPLAKYALPVTWEQAPAIPVLELTRQGYERLLDLSGLARDLVSGAPPALPLGLGAHMAISTEAPRATEAYNILGLLPGRDPLLAQEVVVLSAHYDHVGDDPDGWACPPGVSAIAPERASLCEPVTGLRYPGANDNASGVAVLLEVIQRWRETGYRPRRSVLFAAWAAQEAGQAGLRHYVARPVWSVERTVAVLHLDAVGGGDGYYLGAEGDKLGDGLLRFTIERAEQLLDGRLALSSVPARDDPAAIWRDAGVSTLWLTWREASEENWPAAHADTVEPYRLGVTGKMVALTAMALAQ